MAMNNNRDPIVTETNLTCEVDNLYFTKSIFFCWESMATRMSEKGHISVAGIGFDCPPPRPPDQLKQL
jgi:hypothetical protein